MKKLGLFLIVVACVSWGCKSLNASGRGAATSADPKADVIRASNKLAALNQLSAIVEGEGQLAIRKDVQYVAPDRYHIKFDDSNGAHVEMISIGNKTYIKDGDSWKDFPGEDSPTSTFRNNFTDEVLQTISDVKFEGEDTLNGKPMLVYSYKLLTKVGNFPVSQKIWVEKATGIPIKSVAEYTDSQEKALTTVFDATTPVTIEAPGN